MNSIYFHTIKLDTKYRTIVGITGIENRLYLKYKSKEVKKECVGMERKTKPLTVQISKHLHTRVKTLASIKGLKLKELVVEA
ncbi:hypothetical protein RSJ16_10915 [Paraclostridium sordellii]|nr:hypothetical protein RSJ16_10915 [Paeniclostridium sordellii]